MTIDTVSSTRAVSSSVEAEKDIFRPSTKKSAAVWYSTPYTVAVCHKV